MKLTEKLISENHRDEFSATSGKPSISPSPLRLTSMHFQMLFLHLKKKSNPTRQCSRDCAPVIEIPEISQKTLASNNTPPSSSFEQSPKVTGKVEEGFVGIVSIYPMSDNLTEKEMPFPKIYYGKKRKNSFPAT
ncbi:hypothetical protein TNCV_4610231 [Trichonephila clavipes]|nr:hypothetical protein TNCV_4610231 [Trichonephila clavipes]